MSGYIGKGKSVVNVESYTKAQADAQFLTPTGDGSGLTGIASSMATLSDATVSTSDPAVNSNPSSGVGHLWINSTSGEQYILTDATADNNVWTNVGDGSGAISPTSTVTGGTVTTSGIYTIHTFTASGNLTVADLARDNVEYVVVAGGGGGGIDDGGGGGAGGYRSSVVGESSGGGGSAESKLTLAIGTYAIVVGAGGTGTVEGGSAGTNGGDSTLSTITSVGGGASLASSSSSGGSGAGQGNGSSGAVGAGTSGQGFAGGLKRSDGTQGGGGGGGAAEVGNADGPCHGGDGVSSSINGSAIFRAGGGGAGNRGGTGPAGNGGGGTGGYYNNSLPTAGSANTGGGGGGGQGISDLSRDGANGGSGIVILRYPTPS